MAENGPARRPPLPGLTVIDASQGIGGAETTTFSEVTDEKRYRTRVMSTANKVNLQYEEAAPELNAGLTRVLAGLF